MILIELQPIAPVRQTLRLHIIVNCARETDVSIRVSFRKKNRAQSSVLSLHITADCARRTDGRTLFQF